MAGKIPKAVQARLEWLDKYDWSMIERQYWHEFGASLNDARNAIVKFKKFFAMIGTVKFHVVPTKTIDRIWHFAILDTQFYSRLCQGVHGKFIHHRPFDGSKAHQELIVTNKQKTADTFKRYYGEEYDEYSKYREEYCAFGVKETQPQSRTSPDTCDCCP
jgi:hypothetical protein